MGRVGEQPSGALLPFDLRWNCAVSQAKAETWHEGQEKKMGTAAQD